MSSLIDKLRGNGGKSEADDNTVERHVHNDSDGDDSVQVMATVDGTATNKVNDDAQIGVQEMEATTLVWTKPMLAAYFIV